MILICAQCLENVLKVQGCIKLSYQKTDSLKFKQSCIGAKHKSFFFSDSELIATLPCSLTASHMTVTSLSQYSNSLFMLQPSVPDCELLAMREHVLFMLAQHV